MRALAALALAVTLAGCAGNDGGGAAPEAAAGAAPAGETWYFDVGNGGRFLTLEKPAGTTASGEVLPTVGETRLGPYDAEEPTVGFPAGTPALATLPFTCQHPAQVRLRVELRADGTPVGQGETVADYPLPGPVAGAETATVAFTLSAAAPAGSILSADIVYDGCASFMMGRGGDWARSLGLGAAAEADG